MAVAPNRQIPASLQNDQVSGAKARWVVALNVSPPAERRRRRDGALFWDWWGTL